MAAGPCEVKSTIVPQLFFRNMLIVLRRLVKGLSIWMLGQLTVCDNGVTSPMCGPSCTGFDLCNA